MALYSRVSYWDERYRATTKDGPCEWYQGYHTLKHLLNPIHFAAQSTSPKLLNSSSPLSDAASQAARVHAFPSRENCRVLILGCGNSTFGEDMQRDGWAGRMVNVDFSSVVIDQMKAKYNDSFYMKYNNGKFTFPQKMEFLCADITERLPFDDQSFDLIVCKGSFDAVLCSAGSKAKANRLVKECVRLLACGHGILFLVTHGNPDNRIEYLEYENKLEHYWHAVTVQHVSRHTTSSSSPRKTDYVYICRKRLVDRDRSSCSEIPTETNAPIKEAGFPSENQENTASV